MPFTRLFERQYIHFLHFYASFRSFCKHKQHISTHSFFPHLSLSLSPKPSEKAFPPKRIMPRFKSFFKIVFCMFVCVQARKPPSAFGREGRHRLKRPGDNSRRVRRGKLMKLLGNLCGSEHLCDCQQVYSNHKNALLQLPPHKVY